MSERGYADSWTLRYSGTILSIGGTGAILIAVASLTFLPGMWGGDEIRQAPTEATTDQQLANDIARNNAEAEVRDLGLRIALGFGVISGALVAYGRLQLTRRESERSDKGQANERWTTAVGQLGDEHIEVRLGGVYALEQFYSDAPDDRVRTASILAAFVRANLPPNKPLPNIERSSDRAPLPSDIAAALAALGGLEPHPVNPIELARIDTSADGHFAAELIAASLAHADLYRADLTGADLTDVDLTGARLARANLNGATLTGATLTGADFTGARLAGAKLSRANLSGAVLAGADLTVANLMDADLTRASLTHADLTTANLTGAALLHTDLFLADLTRVTLVRADLTGARLINANLTGANLLGTLLPGADLAGATLTGADLTGVKLTNANLKGATHDETTTWPSGFAAPNPASTD